MATNLMAVLDTGRFNCVSSAVLYNVIARGLGLDVKAIEIPAQSFGEGHVFVVLYDGAKQIPIETTNANGFNVSDNMKKKNKREVGELGLVAIIYYNHGVSLGKENRFHEGACSPTFAPWRPGQESWFGSPTTPWRDLLNWEVHLAENEKRTRTPWRCFAWDSRWPPRTPRCYQPSPVSLAAATEFLHSVSNPVQVGMDPKALDAKRAAALRGLVFKDEKEPFPGVHVAIQNQPRYGVGSSRTDGSYDMVVNGGGLMTIGLTHDDYLPVWRQTAVPWQDYTWLPEVVMTKVDAQVTPRSRPKKKVPAGRPRQAKSKIKDGERQTHSRVPAWHHQATMVLPDGCPRDISIRAKRRGVCFRQRPHHQDYSCQSRTISPRSMSKAKALPRTPRNSRCSKSSDAERKELARF